MELEAVTLQENDECEKFNKKQSQISPSMIDKDNPQMIGLSLGLSHYVICLSHVGIWQAIAGKFVGLHLEQKTMMFPDFPMAPFCSGMKSPNNAPGCPRGFKIWAKGLRSMLVVQRLTKKR